MYLKDSEKKRALVTKLENASVKSFKPDVSKLFPCKFRNVLNIDIGRPSSSRSIMR